MTAKKPVKAKPEHPREATEWIVSYAYNANDESLPRILLIGDSICNGYHQGVRTKLAGIAHTAFFATSKCVTDKSFLRALEFFLDEYKFSVIHFNNGLHSLHTPTDDWERELRKAIKLIKRKCKGSAIFWASSTPLADPALTKKAKALNKIAASVMKEEGVPTNDLFSLMDPLDRKAHWCDTYHFKDEAKDMQADAVAGCVKTALGKASVSKAKAKAALKAGSSKTGPNGAIR